MSLADQARDGDRRLPPGTFTIDSDSLSQVADLFGCGCAHMRQDVHLIFAYIATQRGIGVSMEELFQRADFALADGPLLGSTRLQFTAPLEVDTKYAVTGEIVSIERKTSRKQTVDVFTVRERLAALDTGQIVATVTNTFILPRRGSR